MTVTPVAVTSPGTTGSFTGYTNDDPATGAAQTTGNASLSVLDDWDESDRAKVNPIVGQAGVAAGAGSVSATVQRTTLASDDPAVAILGAAADAASLTTTIKAALRGIATATGITALDLGSGTGGSRTLRTYPDTAAAHTLASQGYSASATFTPAAASHTAGDCVGAAAQFSFGAPSAGRLMITSATLEIDSAAAQATAWRVYLYNVTPTSAIADDGVWNYADSDRSQYLGYIDLPSTAVDIGSNQWVESNGLNKQIKLTGTSVFGYLSNLTTLSTVAVAHIVTIHTVAV